MLCVQPAKTVDRAILLRGQRESARCQRLRAQLSRTMGTATCNIFYLPTSEVDVPGLPAAWELDGVAYDTLTLPCGHVFNPSALALHFLVSDMRCPACRTGPVVRLDADCLPVDALRRCFHDKAASMRTHDEEDALSPQDLLATTDLDIHRIELDLMFTIEISMQSAGAVRSNMLQTRIAPMHEHTRGDFVHYVTQQSFQRLFSRQLARHRVNPTARVRFHVQHPLLPQSLSSSGYPLADLVASARTREFVLPFTFSDEPAGHDPVLATLVFTPPTCEATAADSVQVAPAASDATNAAGTAAPAGTTAPAGTAGAAGDGPPTSDAPGPVPGPGEAAVAHATLLLHRQGVLALCVAAAQHALLNSIVLVHST